MPLLYALLRFFLIFVGIVCSAFAAGATLMLAETSGLMPPSGVSQGEARDALLINTLVLSSYSLLLGFLPAFVAGLLAEIFRWRTIVYFGIAGALIGFYLLFQPIPSWIDIVQDEGQRLVRDATKAYPAAGIVAGAIYWLVTGRKAGFIRDTDLSGEARHARD